MKIRWTQIKWVTERYNNRREMRRSRLTQRVRHIHTQRKIQAGLMMVPPLSESMAMVSPHNTEAQSGHNTTQTHQAQVSFFFFGGGALVKTKLTAGRLSPTIITSQHNITTFLRLHFQEGMKGGRGKRGGGMSLSVTCSQLGRHGALHCPKCWAWQHTYREGVYNGNNQNQYSVIWLHLLQALCVLYGSTLKTLFKKSVCWIFRKSLQTDV